MNRLIVKEKMQEYAGYVVTNLVRGYLIEKRTGTFPRKNIDKLKKYLKKFNIAVR